VSALRIAGIAVAVVLAAIEVHHLSRRRPSAADGLALGCAVLLALVSLVPALANVPADVLHLHHTPGGRLITLLVLSQMLLWPYLFWFAERTRLHRIGVERDLEAMLGLALEARLPDAVAPVVVVMPAYDEEGSVGRVVASLPSEIDGRAVQALVVSDGCRDRTASEARRAGALVMELPANRGAGSALRLGYNYAARAGAAVVVTMDADGQHRAEDLEAVAGPVLRGEADFVIGSRRLGRFEHVSSLRSTGLRLFTGMLNLLFATRLTDCSSGFRALSVDRLPRLETVEAQYHTAETIILARRAGLRITEVPVMSPRRLVGNSKKGGDLIYGLRFGRILLSRWLRG
jgi:hypothetical protein